MRIEDRLYAGRINIAPLYEVRKIKEVKINANYDEALMLDIVQYDTVYDNETFYMVYIENSVRFEKVERKKTTEDVVVDIHVDTENFHTLCEGIQEAITKFMVTVTGCGINYSISKKEAERIREFYEYQKNKEQ